jgi:hypothetical protein
MRKIAREAVIVCLLGAAIGSAYFLVHQYRSFRKEAAAEAEFTRQPQNDQNAARGTPGNDGKTGPGWNSPPATQDQFDSTGFKPVYVPDQPSKALILFQRSLAGAIVGFSAGLAVWCAYRLVRFAILG